MRTGLDGNGPLAGTTEKEATAKMRTSISSIFACVARRSSSNEADVRHAALSDGLVALPRVSHNRVSAGGKDRAILRNPSTMTLLCSSSLHDGDEKMLKLPRYGSSSTSYAIATDDDVEEGGGGGGQP